MQHYLADMWIEIYGARNLVYQAAWKLSEGLPADMEAAMAKAWTSEASRRVTHLGHQIHGAIGFTKEMDLELYIRRCMATKVAFGNGDFHKKRLGEEIVKSI